MFTLMFLLCDKEISLSYIEYFLLEENALHVLR